MSEPLNEEESKVALVSKALKDVFYAMDLIDRAVLYSQLACDILNEGSKAWDSDFRSNQKHSLIELSYLNDTAIPSNKALSL